MTEGESGEGGVMRAGGGGGGAKKKTNRGQHSYVSSQKRPEIWDPSLAS